MLNTNKTLPTLKLNGTPEGVVLSGDVAVITESNVELSGESGSDDDCDKITQCFKYLNSDELKILKGKKTQLTYLQGENLFKQGAFAPYVILILEGLVKVYLQTGLNKLINIRLASTGDFLAFCV